MQNQPDFIPPSIRNRSERKRNGLLGVSLALLLATGAFFSGFQVNNIISSSSQSASLFSLFAFENKPTVAAEQVNLDQFWEVWHLIDQKFISASSTKTLTDQEKINGAIEGMVHSFGDPYTVFLPPVENEKFNEDISGNFSGIGMEVGMRDNVLTVISPLPDTPAEKAGILPGDLIVKINDESTEGMSIDAAVNKIRGEKGTIVNLSVYREGDTKFLDFAIIRDTIDIPTVKTETKEGIFFIKIYSFNAIAEAKFQQALEEFSKTNSDTLVLDLRGNPGGYLQSAASIASYFLPSGKIVVRENFGENAEEKLYRSQGHTFREFGQKKMVVLVDAGSASASEILAGALKEHQAATIIGTNTFGKGSVQELVDLKNGAALKVTIARWLTPDGHSISNGGLAPDILINRTPEQRLKNIDPQQDAAINFLKGKEVVSENVATSTKTSN